MPKLVHIRTRNGIWEGHLSMDDSTPPDVLVTHREVQVLDASVQLIEGQTSNWQLTFTIPPSCISDSLETILITDQATGGILGSYAILSGLNHETDPRAELDLLRAELDMLKRAFRRHCRETMS